MKYIILILILLLIFTFSCTDNDLIENQSEDIVSPKNSMELKVNGQNLNQEITTISAFYSICNETLSIQINSKVNNVTSNLLSFGLLKNGQLIYAFYTDKTTSPTYDYKTADFIPSSTFSIEEFEFIEGQKLHIKFSGNLLKKIWNFNHPSELIEINGNVKIVNFDTNYCNVFNEKIELTEEIKFNSITRITQGNPPNMNVWYNSNSLNGYNIQIINLNDSLLNLPLGTYTFDIDSTSEKIVFQKYIGPPMYYYSNEYIPQLWKTYQTEGEFTILEKNQINGHNVAKVIFNFTASYNGITEFDFNNKEMLISK